MSNFYISFAARHPDKDLTDFLSQLRISPRHCWTSGEERRTPNGTLLEGVHESSYYSCDLPLPEVNDLAIWLENAVNLLTPIANQLVAFADGGGLLSFFITLDKDSFEGCTLTAPLLNTLAKLSISLDFNRYS